MKRTKLKVDDEPQSLLLEHPDPPPQIREGDDEYIEPSLTQEELIALKWQLFGKCPNCHVDVKGYIAGPFNVKHYQSLQDSGIDVLTGHKQTCPTKWMKA